MPGKKDHERAVGPYPHGKGWRVVAINSVGDREYHSFTSEKDCRDFIREFNARAEARTVSDAVEQYLAHLAQHGNNGRGLRDRSIATARYRLAGILSVEMPGQLVDLTPKIGERLYTLRAEEVVADTHRGELALAQAFGAWCVERGWLQRNPFGEVKAVGARTARRKQLRVDAARVFVNAALGEKSLEGLAAALALLTGLRASEVVDRVAGDVDDNGRLLWITDAKTTAGERELEIPAVLRPLIAARVKGCVKGEPMFPGLTRYGLYYHVRRICREAGLDEVGPHALRKSFSSLSSRAGISTEQVARALGHADVAVTRRHYLDSGAEQSAAAARAEGILFEDSSEMETMASKSLPEPHLHTEFSDESEVN